MTHDNFLVFRFDLDLEFDSMTYGLLRIQEKDRNESGQACFFSTHGVLASEHFSPLNCQAPSDHKIKDFTFKDQFSTIALRNDVASNTPVTKVTLRDTKNKF